MALNKETVHIKNRNYVENVISQLIKGGASQLQVISDFDQTISRVHKDGVSCNTTYGILEQSPYLTESYRCQTTNLYNYYHPIEVDPHLSKSEKTHFMIEWYTKSADLMPESGFSKEKLPELVQSSTACLREGCASLFESLNKHNVPLLIFSAGVGDILQEVLKQQNLLLPNMKIIANYMKFDEKNKLLGFKNELIHTFNKNQTSIQNCDYFQKLKNRPNIILLGDTLGDLDMSEGAEKVNVILKIGFLNFKIEQNLSKYMDSYDIVLTDDQTMDVVLEILERIV